MKKISLSFLFLFLKIEIIDIIPECRVNLYCEFKILYFSNPLGGSAHGYILSVLKHTTALIDTGEMMKPGVKIFYNALPNVRERF